MNWKLFWLLVGCVVMLTQCQRRSPDEMTIDDLSKAIRFNPADAAAYYNRGNAYYHLGQYQQAIADYDQVLRLDPNDADAYINRGLAYNELGQREQAMQDWRKACELGYQPACELVE